ncbi:DNA-binding protein [Rhodococcus sp. NPDC056743]|uniref:DNA-binding protein n=1 Tax=Rhodococcus sp. NPDC056743 TaxID=3345934 RepID=UPI003671041A
MTESHSAQPGDGFPKIGAPATRALLAAGYTELSQLSSVSESELAKFHGMGPKALRILGEALAERGLSFSD